MFERDGKEWRERTKHLKRASINNHLCVLIGVGCPHQPDGRKMELENVKEWNPRKIKFEHDQVLIDLMDDRRFLRSYQFIMRDFYQYVTKCLDSRREMTNLEHEYCSFTEKTFDIDKQETENQRNPLCGSACKMSLSMVWAITAYVIFIMLKS
ncbi:Hypothetical predicted protein [Octopus vulgaris]|uniref:Uncharacterized protein n=1 Tax=Octopus vulgaris TaxID=6645 RepID=A0AA36BQT2_OCTVU|nr:Hypothetical predicted protein [Octopus vulgaris]